MRKNLELKDVEKTLFNKLTYQLRINFSVAGVHSQLSSIYDAHMYQFTAHKCRAVYNGPHIMIPKNTAHANTNP